jgi:hypothetical protein
LSKKTIQLVSLELLWIAMHQTGLLEMKQTGLIKQVIEALGLVDGYSKGKHTPSEAKPLVKDLDGEEAHGGFSYSSVVGMLLYMSGHT